MGTWLRTVVVFMVGVVVALGLSAAAPGAGSAGTGSGPGDTVAVDLAAAGPSPSEAGLPFADGTTRQFTVSGTGSLAAQGGSPTGCGIPAGVTAVAVSMQAYGGNAFGYLKSWAAPGAEPQSSVLTYQAGVQTSNGVTLALGPTEPALTIKNRLSPTHVVIDVVGYYLPPIAGLVDPNGSLYSSTARVVSAERLESGAYVVTADRDVTGCAVTATTDNSPGWVVGFTSADLVYLTRYDGPTAVPEDGYVNFHVAC
jgi:hypothetical protein